MDYKSLKFILAFLTLLRAVNLEDVEQEPRCSNFCFCVENESQKLEARCNITGRENSSSSYLFGQHFSRIYSLDLSGTNMRALYTRVLRNLTQLTILNLQFNDMRSWHGNVSRDLPNLAYLNVTGNQHWLPGNDLLSLPKLKIIEGVWWRKECGVCSLSNAKKVASRKNCSDRNREPNGDKMCGNDSKENMCENNECENNNEKTSTENDHEDEHEADEDEDEELEFPFPNKVKYGQLYEFYKLNFIVKCQHQMICYYYENHAPYDNARLAVFTAMKYILYSLGAVSMLINLIVIATVLLRKKLRKSPSFVLVAMLASSDFLTGLYSISQATFTSFISFHQEEILTESTIHVNEVKCNISGILFTTAQVTSPMTSLLLTVERYLVIVYGLNPEKRLNRKTALRFWLLAWVVAMVTAAVPFFADGNIKYHPVSHCSLPNTYETNASLAVRTALLVTTCGLMAPYIIGILLYLRIYVNVKRSGQEMGNRTDLKVAKKISSIVFTNLVFFVIPTVLLYFHSNFYNNTPEIFTEKLTAHRVYLFVFSCFPLFCFNINACLNPFLFALRNDTFKQQLVCLVTCILRGGRERSLIPKIHTNNELSSQNTTNINRFNKNTARQSNVSMSYFNEGIQLEEKTKISNVSHGSL